MGAKRHAWYDMKHPLGASMAPASGTFTVLAVLKGRSTGPLHQEKG